MIDYEILHLKNEYRVNGDYIKVLHPDFREIGASGRMTTMSDYHGLKLPPSDLEVLDYKVTELSEGCRLSTYTLVDKMDGRKTNRSSIWVTYDNDWKMIFHQGTVVN
ncbi:DUF4440 domain-containing protein [Macrococcus lamae]|uniref:DUF4440 domain-containing protein n=1 Tax=Macrococcus lamae TaxID=198484 RepID=A0A4R6BST8_9STAP|nr:DUF4440 domain-containing protein [Macrococcus lamae]TDM05222.1 hypothetical protein ERX29_10465 [Macrococcus lamae]